MRTIPLTQGQLASVDDEDYELLSQVKWNACWSRLTRSFYARRLARLSSGRWVPEYMARRILGLNRGDKRQADHLDHNTLNNCRNNLRVVTSRQNNENRRRHSRYGIGVYLKPNGNRYQAMVHLDGVWRHVGYFATAEEAQAARRAWLKKREVA